MGASPQLLLRPSGQEGTWSHVGPAIGLSVATLREALAKFGPEERVDARIWWMRADELAREDTTP